MNYPNNCNGRTARNTRIAESKSKTEILMEQLLETMTEEYGCIEEAGEAFGKYLLNTSGTTSYVEFIDGMKSAS